MSLNHTHSGYSNFVLQTKFEDQYKSYLRSDAILHSR